ncbi:MAG: TonB-dependent receptor, partial [Bacteroidales bacterium]|nr:TonB-dependent receptor [Bacteroidales bacterium]
TNKNTENFSSVTLELQNTNWRDSDENCSAFQQYIVSGVVIDATDDEPLPGVNIMIKGTNKGVITDLNGKYSLGIDDPDAVLVFSFIGYLTEEVQINGQTEINISLTLDIIGLDEVVVIGYGSMKKRDLTGAVASIKSEDLNQTNPVSFEQGLQGRVSGVLVTQNDGAPGGGISVTIRGSNSFSNSQPLYVIDGVPIGFNNSDVSPETGDGDIQQNNALAFLDPRDIESIEILKDASATAIYGSRGANGVVLITTKKGKSGYMKIEVNTELGLSNVSNKIEVMSPRDFASYKNESHFWTEYWKAGAPGDPEDFVFASSLPYPGSLSPTGVYKKAPEDYGNVGSLWQNTLFRTGVSKKYGIGVYGGSDNTLYSFRYNHTNQEGIIINSGFERDGLNFNINSNKKKWFSIGTSANLARIKYSMFKTADESLSSAIGLIKSAILLPPTYAEDGLEQLDEGEFWAASSPIAYANAPEESNLWNIFSSSFFEIKFLPNLKLKTVLGYSSSLSKVNKYSPRTVYEGSNYDGIARAADKWWQGYNLDNILTFDQQFVKHNINAMVTTSYEASNWYSKKLEARGFGTDILQGWDLASATDIVNCESGKGEQELLSFLGRLNYNYDSRYYFTFSMRRDGSSKFSKNNKWGTFPSLALSWNIANENFMKEFKKIDNLKIRYTIGQIGNQGISAYSTLAQYTASNYQFGDQLENGYSVSRYNPGNENLKWETTTQHNLGIDIGLLDNRIVIAADAYYKITDDLLRNILTVPSTGIYQQAVNIGKVENKGIELFVKGVILSGRNFNWQLDANISANRNKILKYGTENDAKEIYGPSKLEGLILTKNHPIGQLYGWIEDGYWNSVEEYKNSTFYQKLDVSERPNDEAIVQNYLGEIKYLDLNNDSIIDDYDRDFIGDVNPNFIFGITNSFSYKGFDLSFFIQGVIGNKIINGMQYNFNQVGYWSNIPKENWENAWRFDNTDAKFPKLYNNDNRQTRFSSRYVEDGSYVKLKSVSLSYNFKKTIKYVDNIKVYVNATNLFTITNYSGFDPEVNSYGSNSSRYGIDVGSYPCSRTYTFGLQVTF